MQMKAECAFLPRSLWPAFSRPWITAVCDDGGDGGGGDGGDGGGGDGGDSGGGDGGTGSEGGQDSGAGSDGPSDGGDGDNGNNSESTGSSDDNTTSGSEHSDANDAENGSAAQASGAAASEQGQDDDAGFTNSASYSAEGLTDSLSEGVGLGAGDANMNSYQNGINNTYQSGLETEGGGAGTNNGMNWGRSGEGVDEGGNWTADNNAASNLAPSHQTFDINLGYVPGEKAGILQNIAGLVERAGVPGISLVTSLVNHAYAVYNGSTVVQGVEYGVLGPNGFEASNPNSIFGTPSEVDNQSTESLYSSPGESNGSSDNEPFGAVDTVSESLDELETPLGTTGGTQTTSPVVKEEKTDFVSALIFAVLLAAVGL